MPTQRDEIERAAAATKQLYDSLDSRIGELSRSVQAFSDEFRSDLRAVDSTTRSIEKNLERMHGENVSEQVKKNEATIEKLEGRLRACENFQNNLTGRLLIIGVIATAATGTIVAVVVKLLAG